MCFKEVVEVILYGNLFVKGCRFGSFVSEG